MGVVMSRRFESLTRAAEKSASLSGSAPLLHAVRSGSSAFPNDVNTSVAQNE